MRVCDKEGSRLAGVRIIVLSIVLEKPEDIPCVLLRKVELMGRLLSQMKTEEWVSTNLMAQTFNYMTINQTVQNGCPKVSHFGLL